MIMELAGYICAALMGVLLGLIGGGGSILTVPILVYLFNTDPMLSTAYSLFIVGSTSLAGSVSHFKKGNINLKIALIFGTPSIAAVFAIRRFVVPIIPENIFSVGNFVLTKNTFVLGLFATLMILAAWSMIKPSADITKDGEPKKIRYPIIILDGIIVGALTGLVGAGGGFLIIPALVVLTGLTMKEAVGTSLLIITLKSLIGFLGDLPGTKDMDYQFLIVITLFSMAGIIAGSNLSRSIDSNKLKPIFGWFVLVTGTAMLIKELFIT